MCSMSTLSLVYFLSDDSVMFHFPSPAHTRKIQIWSALSVFNPVYSDFFPLADLKRTIAVLLDDILQRLVKLENKVDYIVVNGSATNTTNGTGGNLVPVTTNKRINASGSIR